MKTTSCSFVCWLLTTMATAGCGEADSTFTLGGYRYATEELSQWALPDDLREVSGLALGPGGRLFAHGDETALIYELDYRTGRSLKRFAVGDPPLLDDFEGITWAGDTLFLVTSDGDLLATEEAADGGHAPYRRYETKLGQRCEIEGLDYDPGRRLLLMACKTPREAALRRRIAVLAWSLESSAPAPDYDIRSPPAADGSGKPRLHPSGLARSPGNGNLILPAARQRALIELDPGGEVLRAFTLPRSRGHPQMEGIAIDEAGNLVIADEGGAQRGRLSVYPARQ